MIGAAVHDPKRRFAIVNYRIAKGLFENPLGMIRPRRGSTATTN
jgi:hypothetical protein